MNKRKYGKMDFIKYLNIVPVENIKRMKKKSYRLGEIICKSLIYKGLLSDYIKNFNYKSSLKESKILEQTLHQRGYTESKLNT
jgi:hypothetical protein